MKSLWKANDDTGQRRSGILWESQLLTGSLQTRGRERLAGSYRIRSFYQPKAALPEGPDAAVVANPSSTAV